MNFTLNFLIYCAARIVILGIPILIGWNVPMAILDDICAQNPAAFGCM